MCSSDPGNAMSGFGGFDPSKGDKSGFGSPPPVDLPPPVAPPVVGTPLELLSNQCCGIPRAVEVPTTVQAALAVWPEPLGSLPELKGLSASPGWPGKLADLSPTGASESWKSQVRSAIVRWRLLESAWNAVLNEVFRTPNFVMAELWRQSGLGESFKYLEAWQGGNSTFEEFGQVAAILEATEVGEAAQLYQPKKGGDPALAIGKTWILAVGRIVRKWQVTLGCPVSLSSVAQIQLLAPMQAKDQPPTPMWTNLDDTGVSLSAVDHWIANLTASVLTMSKVSAVSVDVALNIRIRLWNASYSTVLMWPLFVNLGVHQHGQSVVQGILTWQRRCATQPLPPGFPWPNYAPIRLDTAVATAIGPKDSDVPGVQATLAKALQSALTSSSDAASQTALRGIFTGALVELRTLIAVGVATGWLPADEFLELVPILMDVSVAENVRLHGNGKGKFGADHVFALAPSPFAWANAVLQEPPMTWFW